MAIEKRLSRRVDMNMPAILRWRGEVVAEAGIENVNLDGMMICTNAESVHRGAILDIAFEFGDESWYLPVMVVHARDDRRATVAEIT